MRKILILLLGAIMTLPLLACGGGKDDNSSKPNKPSSNSQELELPEDPF